MPRRSNNLRYFLASLRPLAQPIVWAPATILALAVVFVWDFWVNPRQDGLLGNAQSSQGQLSPDDQAIGADIDNISLLMKDFGLVATKQPDPLNGQALIGSSAKPNAPGNSANNATNNAANNSALNILTGAQSGQLLLGSTLSGGNANSNLLTGGGFTTNSLSTSGNSSISSSGTVGNRSGLGGLSLLGSQGQSRALPVNVLQQALTASQSNASGNGTAQSTTATTPANGLSQTLPTPLSFPTLPTASSNSGFPSLPGQTSTTSSTPTTATSPVPVNSYTSLTGGASTSSVPAPVQVNPTFSSPFNSNPFNSNPFGQSSSQQLGNSGNAQAQQQPQMQPSPNGITPLVPGRYIGGGQINTFSDPLGLNRPRN